MSKIDLSQLTIDESATRPRRRLGPTVLAGAVFALLLAVAATFLWPLLRPVREVPTASIAALDLANTATSASLVVAEAVGWVEPDPFPTIVKPLVPGRITTLAVLEGHAVKAGETVLASLESAALLAARDRAVAELAERESEHSIAMLQHQKAVALREQRGDLRASVADATLALKSAETRLVTARGNARQLGAAARASEAAEQAQERLAAEGVANPVARERARAEASAANAATATAVAEIDTIERELDASRALLVLQQELLDQPVDLEWDVRVAAAEVDRAARNRDKAATELAVAERELQWARAVLAPVDGVVMRLLASPGDTTGPEGAGIVSLYDPGKLQARLDVPLGTIANVRPGQRVELTSEITGRQVVQGIVQRIQRESDLLKNTLQVKVTLIEPPAIWRPETLCRARFLGGGGDNSGGGETPQSTTTDATFAVPRAAVRSGHVFVIDPARGVARAIAVTVVGEDGDRSIVKGDLSVAQRVITVEVTDGESVKAEQQ